MTISDPREIPVGSHWTKVRGEHAGNTIEIVRVGRLSSRVRSTGNRYSKSRGHLKVQGAVFNVKHETLFALYEPDDSTVRIIKAPKPERLEVATIEPAPTVEATAMVEESGTMDTDSVSEPRFSLKPGVRRAEFTTGQAGKARSTTDEQEQAVLSDYVDHPEMTIGAVAARHGMTHSQLAYLVGIYDVPLRRPNRKPPTRRTETPAFTEEKARELSASVDQTSGTVFTANEEVVPMRSAVGGTLVKWRVTVVRTVVDIVEAEDLLGIAAHYDGTGADVIKVERVQP